MDSNYWYRGTKAVDFNQIPVLAAAGYFAVAPNQRGYAPARVPTRPISITTGSTN